MQFWLWLILQVGLPILVAAGVWVCWYRCKRSPPCKWGTHVAAELACEAVCTLDLYALHNVLEEYPSFVLPTFRTKEGLSLLHLAVKKSEGPDSQLLEMCYYLVQNCFIDVDANNNAPQLSALHVALQNGKENAAVYLIKELGASFALKDTQGCTAVHSAARHGALQVLIAIVETGGRCILTEENVHNENALSLSLENKHTACSLFLFQTGMRLKHSYQLAKVMECREKQELVREAAKNLGALPLRLSCLSEILAGLHVHSDVVNIILDYCNMLELEEAFFFLRR